MAKPKLALIPASQGPLVYSVLPSDGSGDFSFSRGSSATRINSQGLIETVASGDSRLEYPLIDGVVSGCPSLLLEPARTNYVTYSNGFTDSSWLTNNSTVVSGVISPDGASNAFTLSNTSASGIIQKPVALTGLRVVSIFAKKGTHRYLSMGAYGGTNSYANFDLENGVVADGTNANIEDYGNGWFRCICHSADGTTGGVQISPSNNAIGAATTNGSIYIYGAQLEQGSYPTSYIPTNGELNGVTRSAETANGAGDASTFNDSEGVLMAEISALSDGGTYRLLSLNDGGAGQNFVTLGFDTASTNLYVSASNAISATAIPVDVKSFNKISLQYKSGNNNVYVNGFKLISNTNTFTPGNQLSELEFSYYTNTLQFYGKTKQLQYFQTALTDSELETLTSWTSFTAMAQGQTYSIK